MARRSPGGSGAALDRLRPYLTGPLVTLVVVTVLARLIGVVVPDDGIGWVDAVRGGLAAMFAVAATAHFGRSRIALIRMVPEGLPNRPLIVTVTGLLEIAGVVGLIVPETARLTAICLAALLVVIAPATVSPARHANPAGGNPASPRWFRTVVQSVLVAACLLVALAG